MEDTDGSSRISARQHARVETLVVSAHPYLRHQLVHAFPAGIR
jgi:hypothetical protein